MEAILGLRILPMACMLDGYTVWANGTNALAISSPEKPVPAPKGADTAIVSVDDYRRISARLIAEQEQ